MFAYVARQPIFNLEKEVYAYEILFRDGKQNCFPEIEPDEATSKILTNSHLSVGLDELANGKLAFVNFHEHTLLNHFPTFLEPEQVIVEVVETVDVSEAMVTACRQLSEKGYTVALDDYDNTDKWEPLLPFVQVVKMEVDALPEPEMRKAVQTLKALNMSLVIERIETHEQFELYKDMGFDYFQGYFLAKPQIVQHRKLSTSQLAMMELLVEVNKTPLDFDKINAVIERDVALTFKLLRFINNPTINKRVEIKTLRHAFNYMGEEELKKFIALMALANISESEPEELLNMSLVRAKFCEMMLQIIEGKNETASGFLTGLLSLIDTMTGQEMDQVISKIPLDKSVADALCKRAGMLTDCLVMVRAYENANWKALKLFAQKYPIKQTQLHSIYLESLKWASTFQNA